MVYIVAGLLIVAILLAYFVYTGPVEPWICLDHGEPHCAFCRKASPVPIGIIVQQTDRHIPVEYLIPLDGRTLKRSDYPELFKAITQCGRHQYFPEDSEYFNLPEMKGYAVVYKPYTLEEVK